MLPNHTHFLTRFHSDENASPRARLRGLVAAAVSGAGVAAGVERANTRAARDRVGVVHGEAAAHQAVHEIDLGALDVLRADRVDKQPYATHFTDGVAFFSVVLEAHAIRHARASARLDEDTQPQLRVSLFLQEITQLGDRRVADADQLGVLFDHFLSHVRPIIPPDFAESINFEL